MAYNVSAIRGGFGDSQSDIVIACYDQSFFYFNFVSISLISNSGLRVSFSMISNILSDAGRVVGSASTLSDSKILTE